ncbi:phage tail sheath family protein [Nonomuraea sp. NPDC050790]|uniref:phage tail sheath family protein n=1 Tax=Nonomuraea sp. NPDC050790 TaxID=3364371 RepID=UPI00379EA33E
MPELPKSPGVYIETVDSGSRPIEGVGTAVAAFVGFASKGPSEPTLVTSWSQYAGVFGESFAGGLLAHAVYGFFLNGGSACYVVRIGGDGAAPQPAPQAMLGSSFRIVAKELPEKEQDDISVEVSKLPPEDDEQPEEERFTITVRREGKVEETFDFPAKSGKGTLPTAVRQSKLIRIEEVGQELAKLEATSVALKAPPPPPVLPAKVSPEVYIGSEDERTGFRGLAAVDAVTMIAIPDLMGALEREAITPEGVKSVQNELNAHCALMKDRMAILDAPPGLSAQGLLSWKNDLGLDSMWATLYHPWIKVFDPETKVRRIPPSGHIAGVWARSDATRGVHKAPANEVIHGAIALESQLTREEQDLINPTGVNCIRVMPGRGIRVWGARTLAATDKQWQYLNVRRLFNYLQESILNGTQWVVFEPNDDALWARIRRTIAAFLVMEWRRGALFGLTPDEAFYVKCDRETNPAESIDKGLVVCEIGVAPVKPAEFVVFRLAQMASGTSLVSE